VPFCLTAEGGSVVRFAGRDSTANAFNSNERNAPPSGKKHNRIKLRMVTLNQRVQGSSPCAPTKLLMRFKHLFGQAIALGL
jgi:hypothetical protein